MKTITLRVILQYISRYGVFWTAGFLARYALARGTFEFRLPGYGARVFRARKGTSDVRVFNQVVVRRSYDLPVALNDVSVIVDAGANAGYASLFFANAYPDAYIIPIEPDESNFKALTENVRSIKKAEPFFGALWSTKTRLSIQNPNAPKTAIRVGEGDDGLVPTITIPEIVQKHGRIDILKIDIEGAELELFAADTKWLDDVRCLIIELHDFMRQGTSMSFYRALYDRTYEQHISGENLIILFPEKPRAGGTATSGAKAGALA